MSEEKAEFQASSSLDLEDDDRELAALGYKPSFKREFSNLATVRTLTQCLIPFFKNILSILSILWLQISFAFSIMVR